MLSIVKRIILFLNLVINHGISPSTILSNKRPLNGSSLGKLHEGKDKHGV